MKQTLTLNGAINKDSNPLYLEEGQVLSRKNCRVASADGGRGGINVSVKGMTEIESSLPLDGNNRIIGAVEDAERDQAFFANYNSIQNHGIYRLKNDVVDLISQGDFWNFQVDKPVSMDVLGDTLFLTDGFNEPRKLNIVDTPSLSADNINVAVAPPSSRPTVQLGSDDTRVVNKLVGKTFQFSYMYVYDDYTYSVLSPYSEIVVSSSVFSAEDNTYEDNFVGNFVNIGYDVGSDDVRSVRLLAREGNTGSWFVVDDYDKDGESAYDPRTYSFYNDAARQGLIETNAQLLYSDVPRSANSLAVVENRLTMGGVKKGYDKADGTPQITYDVEYETAVLTPTVVELTNAKGQTGTYIYAEFDVPATLLEGDVISVNFKGSYLGGDNPADIQTSLAYEYSFSYIVTAEDVISGAQVAVQNAFSSDIVTKGNAIVTSYSRILGVPYPNAYYAVQGAIPTGKVQLIIAGVRDASWGYEEHFMLQSSTTRTTPAQGVSTHKAGSYKNVGILYYDKYSRTSGVTSPQRVYVPHNGERDYADVNDKAKISFSISDATQGVPSWAEYYRFAITESINFAGVYPFVSGNNSGEDAYLTYLDGKWVIALNMPTNLQYEFVKGDYLLLEQDSGSAITTIRKNIIGTRTIIEISGTEKAGFWLIIPKGDEALSDYEGQFATIYRTKDTVEDLVYFESSETFDISGGAMQTLSGDIGGEDAWFTLRKFEWEGGVTETPTVEDFYINVDDGIRAYSKGRPVIEIDLDTLGEITLQDVVWSDAYLDNTKINGVSMFVSSNRKQLDEKDGGIRRLLLVGDVLKAVQDNKETSLYVGSGQFRDSSGNLTTVQVGNFIGDTYPSVDDYGSRYHDSIVKYNRNLYYWDGDKGEVIRSSPNGQIAISDYGMKSEFLRIKRDADSATSVKVVSHFDERNNMFGITFDIDGACETWMFLEGENRWVEEWDYTDVTGNPPTMFVSIGSQVYSFLDNTYKHESNSSYNLIYGTYKPLSLRGVVNTPQTLQKVLKSVKIDSNRAPSVTFESPVSNTAPLGMKSYLYPATFRERMGEYVSAVLKNVLTTSGEDISLIHSGRDITGFYIEIEIGDSGTTEFQLRTIDVNMQVDE